MVLQGSVRYAGFKNDLRGLSLTDKCKNAGIRFDEFLSVSSALFSTSLAYSLFTRLV